jgi:hypothetical protein
MATKRGLMNLLVLCQVAGGLLLCFGYTFDLDSYLQYCTINTQKQKQKIISSTVTSNTKQQISYQLHTQATKFIVAPYPCSNGVPIYKIELPVLTYFLYTSIDTNHHVIPVTKSQLLAKKL